MIRHIEFVGPPGAGKSTLAQGLTSQSDQWLEFETAFSRVVLSTSRLPIESLPLPEKLNGAVRTRLWRYWLQNKWFDRFKQEYPVATTAIQDAVRETGRSDTTLDYFRERASRVQMVRSRYDCGIVFDDSLLQFMKLAFEASEDIGQRYLDSVQRGEVVVVVDADSVTCINRQDARSKGRPAFLKGGYEEALSSIKRYKESMYDALNYLNSYIFVDTTDTSVSKSIASIEDQIDQDCIKQCR